jgi:hypothetical protein
MRHSLSALDVMRDCTCSSTGASIGTPSSEGCTYMPRTAHENWNLSRSLATLAVPSTNSHQQHEQASSVEEGLDLLIQGSPIREGDAVDEDLLDYDSDSSGKQVQLQQEGGGATTMDLRNHSETNAAMDTDQSRERHPPQKQDGSIVNTDLANNAVYHQCRSARVTSYRDSLVSKSQDESFGKRVSVQSATIGSLEDHDNLGATFHGSRVMKGSMAVNQSISSSFDPAKLNCISCDKEHPFIGNTPVVVVLSDQNFVSTLTGVSNDCINIVRIENATLSELLETAKEIFLNVTFPEGSIFLIGTASYLGRIGVSL